MKRALCLLLLLASCGYGGWDPTKPADDRAYNLRDDDIRANFAALATMLDISASATEPNMFAAFNVQAFGAVADGETDDATAIQAAIDAAEVVAGTVYIPAGIYAIGSQLTITEPIRVIGAGSGQKAEQDVGTYLYKIDDYNGIYVSAGAKLEHFCVDSDGSDGSGKCGIYVHVTDPSFRVTMRDVRIINQGGDGLSLYETNCGLYDSVIGRDNGGTGILLSGYAAVPNCNANTFINCKGYNNDANGISLHAYANENTFIGGEASSNNDSSNGYYCNTYGNIFIGTYAEANGGEDFVLGTTAKANMVMVAVPPTVVDNSGASAYNIVIDRQGSNALMFNRLRSLTSAVINTYVSAGTYMQIGGNADAAGYLKFMEDTDYGTSYTRLMPADANLTSNLTFRLPSDDGDASQLLTTNGSGVLSWSDSYLQATVDCNAAEVNALAATQITLVAAQGAGTLIEFVGATLILDVTAQYDDAAGDGDLQICYTDGDGTAVSAAIEADAFIDAAADAVTFAIPVADPITAASACVNKALVLDNDGDEFTGGTGELRVIITYRVHTSLGL